MLTGMAAGYLRRTQQKRQLPLRHSANTRQTAHGFLSRARPRARQRTRYVPLDFTSYTTCGVSSCRPGVRVRHSSCLVTGFR